MFGHSKRLFSLFAIFALLAWPVDDLYARGKRGGSFGGSTSSSSSSRSSRPSFSTSSSSSSSRSSSSSSSGWSWGSSSSSRNTAPSSRSDSTLTSKVNRGGTNQSRGEAVESQRSPTTHAPDSNTSPGRSTFDSSSSPQRGYTYNPSRVPQTMRLPDGRHAPVYLDNSRGGYGFWDSVGNFVLLSALMNSMNRDSYQPQYAPNTGGSWSGGPNVAPGPSRNESSSGAGAVLAVLGLIILAVLIIAGIFMHRMGKSAGKPQPLDARFAPPNRKTPMPPPIPGSGPLDEWVNLPPGSFVTLSDAQALEDSQKRGDGLRGIDYKVESVGVVKDLEGFATWVLAHIDDGHQKLLLMIKGDESHVDRRVYYQSEDFRPAKREAVIRRGDTWLFEAPSNPNNFNPADLRYAAEIPYSADGQEIVYVRKDHGERHGKYTEQPAMSGLGAMIATVAEYSTGDQTDNPELLILEIATATSKTGEVALYLGAPIRENEASVVKAT